MYARRAVEHAKGHRFESFAASTDSQDAIMYCLAIVGEAARRLSPQARELLHQFDWNAMTGMRNILVHDYGRVSLELVWDVIENDLPKLIRALDEYLSSFQ